MHVVLQELQCTDSRVTEWVDTSSNNRCISRPCCC